MGYYTYFEGEIAINPPLTSAQIEDSRFNPKYAGSAGGECLKFSVYEGHAEFVVAIASESFKAYEVTDDLQEIVNTYPDHRFTGYLSAFGEEGGDIWRLRVVDGKAVEVRPRIIWPDGSEGL